MSRSSIFVLQRKLPTSSVDKFFFNFFYLDKILVPKISVIWTNYMY